MNYISIYNDIINEYVETEITIRELAKKYGYSKSTIHAILKKIRKEPIKYNISIKMAETINEMTKTKKLNGQKKGGHITKKLWKKKRIEVKE